LINRLRVRVSSCALLVVLISSLAFGQAATSSITGTVLDSAGGAIPGAAVVVKNESGVSFEAVSNGEGLFNIPGVAPGVYHMTVSLSGFKTVVIRDVRVIQGTPASLKAVLEVGQLSETVNVAASSELINTQTATVSSTLNADQLNRMPTPTRNALNAVTFLPGINTATTNRESRINGLPESFVSITLDGVSNNDNFLRSSDSFFASVTPRQDAIEAVAVTTAVQGATTGGSGAVSINFTTRSGSNKLTGSAYEYFRNTYTPWLLNTNYWFNTRNSLPKNEIKLNQYGARLGGPVVIPGLYDGHNKAFFFAHYEQLRFDNTLTRTRTLLNPRSTQGWFRYTVSGQVREVNVLDLARANGQSTALDPMMMSLISRTAASTQTPSARGTVSATSDPLVDQYVWLSPGRLFEHQPTFKIDYNLNDHHRLTGSYQIIWSERDPDYLNNADVRFPGATNFSFFHSRRPLHSYALRSTLSGNKVNEVRVGITAKGGASYFGDDASNGIATFADQGGYAIVNPLTTDWFVQNGPTWRSAPTYSIDESLTWQKGKHSLSFGGGMLIANAWEAGQTIVPTVNIGFSTTSDPARGLFNTTNFPGASTDQLGDARGLYAFLTGRVSSIGGTAALDPATGKYVAFAPRRREGSLDVYSGYAQDQWRLSSGLTLTAGLRYDLQTAFSASNDIMSTVTLADVCGISGLGPGGVYGKCNMFAPGASGGVTPTFKQLTDGTQGYNTDKNNFGPSVSVAWRPDVQSGWLRTLLGDPEQATIRAGYTTSYERQGMGVFTGTFGANPGSTISLARTEALGNLVLPGEAWPVYLSQSSRIYPAPFNETPSFPIPVRAGRADSLNGFAPDLEVASAGTWTVSLQRAVSRNMAVEARYVGTRGWNQWSTLNYNTVRGESLLTNGFLDEFRLAMANLLANNSSGVASRQGSFAYFGAGTGTFPLPIYLAYMNGSRDVNNPAAYSGTNWTNTTFAGRFVQSNPNPTGSAGTDLEGNSTRRGNAVNAGLPANLFVPNPAVGNNNLTDSGAFSDYHALQLELRRRLANGFSANVNYQYALEGGSAFDGFSFGRVMVTSPNVRHAIKTQWDWTIPVGRGHRFGSDMGSIMNGVLGGWSFNGVGRIQARVVDFGNVRLVGMSKKDLQKMYKFDIRVDPSTGLNTVYVLPADVILNTRRAFSSSSSTISGYSASLGEPEGRYIAPANSASCIQIRAGDCAPRELIIRAPWFTRFDIGIGKQFPIHGRTNFEVKFDLLNVFDNVNFDPVANPGSGATIFQTTTAYTDPSNTYDPGGRLGQIMFRINW